MNINWSNSQVIKYVWPMYIVQTHTNANGFRTTVTEFNLHLVSHCLVGEMDKCISKPSSRHVRDTYRGWEGADGHRILTFR